MESYLKITYEDEDGNIEKVVEFPDCPTSILHASKWIDMLIDIHDPRRGE